MKFTSRNYDGFSVDEIVQRKTWNGRDRRYNPILVWAQDRYEVGKYEKLKKKPFLVEMQGDKGMLERDASDTLRLLLDSEANPHVQWRDTMQSPFHACMSDGFPNCVKALMDEVSYNLDTLAQKDSDGDSMNGTYCSLKCKFRMR